MEAVVPGVNMISCALAAFNKLPDDFPCLFVVFGGHLAQIMHAPVNAAVSLCNNHARNQ